MAHQVLTAAPNISLWKSISLMNSIVKISLTTDWKITMNSKQEESKTKVPSKEVEKINKIYNSTDFVDLVKKFILYNFRHLLVSLIYLVFICVSVFAQQNRWSYVGVDANGTRFFTDRNSIEIKGNKLRIWNKSVYSDNSYRLDLVEWICDEKKYFIVDVSIHSPNGILDGKDKGTNWLLVTPDSISESLYKIACGISTRNNAPKSGKRIKAAQVIVKKANVRVEPNISSAVIKKVKNNDSFILANENPINGWYQIIFSGTNRTGWIHGNTIKLVEIADNKKARK